MDGAPRQSRFEIWADRTAAGFGFAAALLLMLMMGVTFIDVIGRYAFNSPLDGAFELTQVMLALLVFSGLPLVCRSEEHVSVTLLTDRLPPRLQSLHAILINLICGTLLMALAWRLLHRADRLVAYGDVTTFYRLPLGPVATVMAILAAISALFLITNAILRLLAPSTSAR